MGAIGPQGATGAQGSQGSQGSGGARGPQGAVGATGSQGSQGSFGAQGGKGGQGAQGNSGAAGPPQTGAQGAQGAQGLAGYNGPQGAQGAQGPQGSPGPTGAQGAQGSPGPTGPTAVTCSTFFVIGGCSSFYICNFPNTFCNPYTVYSQLGYLEQDQQLYDTLSDCQSSNTGSWSFGYIDLGYGYYTYGATNGSGYYDWYGYCSDRKIKYEIKTLENTLPKIMELDVVEYDWNEKLISGEYIKRLENNKLHSIGLIAQNVKEFFPTVVRIGGDGYYIVDYYKMNAVLIQGIKEQQVFIDDIENQIKELETLLS